MMFVSLYFALGISLHMAALSSFKAMPGEMPETPESVQVGKVAVLTETILSSATNWIYGGENQTMRAADGMIGIVSTWFGFILTRLRQNRPASSSLIFCPGQMHVMFLFL